MKTDGSERSLLVAFVPQGIAVGCNQGRWQREIAASSVMQREMRAVVEGIREIAWLKGWWTEGGRLRFLGLVLWLFWVRFGAARKREDEEEKKKEEEEKKKEEDDTCLLSPCRSRLRVIATHVPRRPQVTRSPSSPAGNSSSARGDRTSPRKGRKIEATLLADRYANHPLSGSSAVLGPYRLIQ
ncbi:hypothetical protein BHM03_00056983, partial [Ensete ventricosum]